MCHFLCNTRNIVGTLRTKQKWIILLKLIMVYDFKKIIVILTNLSATKKPLLVDCSLTMPIKQFL
jgi:hypothetical protein